jgi:glyceraldehyde 3-phosphate dehydrogenase
MGRKVAINGFGRIGRLIFRQAHASEALEFVAVNDLTDAKTLAHLLKYDSLHGTFDAEVRVEGDTIVVNGKPLRVLAQPDPGKLPWKELGVELVLEASGRFTKADQARSHLAAGASWVLITAPAKGAELTLVYGVNHHLLDPGKHRRW